jgi:GntR family uxuAB operon transcriptional repressor
VAALAAVNATSDDLDTLRQAIQRMTTHVDDFVIREETDREFHLGIAKATGNGSLELVVEGLWNQRAELWGRMQQHYHTEALARRTIHDHAAILAAIAARNPDAARTAMHRHLARVVREFQRGGNGKTKVASQSKSRGSRQAKFNGKGGVT